MKVDDFLNTMMSFVGITESPPGSNHTPIGKEFGWDGVAWCAETISVACARNGFPLHEAAVTNIEKHARAGDWGMSWSSSPVRGAATIFDFGGKGNPSDMHTGAVRDILAGSKFNNIEGNHRDRCEVVLRDMTYVRGFAVFPFEAPAAPAPRPFGGTIVNGAKHPKQGHALVGADGGVFCYNGAPFFGSLPGLKVKPSAPIVSIAWTKSGNGYWLLGMDGGVFNFGDAKFRGAYGTLPASVRNDPNRLFDVIVAHDDDDGYVIISTKNEPYDF